MAGEKAPALPGEVWRGVDCSGDTVAVCRRDDGLWTYTWGPPEFGPFEWWGTIGDQRDHTLCVYAEAMRARAEEAEARLRPVVEAARAYQAAAAELRMWGQRSGKSEALQAVVSAALATVAKPGGNAGGAKS